MTAACPPKVVGLALLLIGVCTYALAPPALALSGTLIVESTGPGSGYPSTVETSGALTEGPDGAMWLLGSMTSLAGTVQPGMERLLPSAAFSFFPFTADGTVLTAANSGIVSGPDRALWFTGGYADDLIGQVRTSGAANIFHLPSGDVGPGSIVVGPDGALWFTCEGGRTATCDGSTAIGRITTAGQITFLPLPSDQTGDPPGAIANGPGGTIWFAATEGNTGRALIDVIGLDGQITELPNSVPAFSQMVLGPDGAMWSTDSTDNAIGRITPSGSVTSYPIPTAASEPTSITVGPDGALWFTEYVGYKIGRITTTGQITEYPVAIGKPYDEQLQPAQIASGPGKTLWFSTNGSSPSIVGYLTPGAGAAPQWTTLYSHRPGTASQSAPKLIGRLPHTLRLRHGRIRVTLRFAGRGSVLIGISAYPRSLAIGYQYKHTFTVKPGRNELVLRLSAIAPGNHELFVFPMLHGASAGKSAFGRVRITKAP